MSPLSYDQLLANYQTLSVNYEALSKEHDQLKTEYACLKADHEQLALANAQLRSLLKQALESIQQLQTEVSTLKEQINRNSKNSSKPPSTDQKSNTKDKPTKQRTSRSGQSRLQAPPGRVDRHVECTASNCPHCGSHDIQQSQRPAEKFQQAELPQVKAIITEYSLLKYACVSCGKQSTAPLPPGVPDSAFGPQLMALLAYLTGVLHLAKREAILLIKNLYDVDVGLGSVPNVEERVAQAIDGVYARIHSFVIGSLGCKHFDETGWRDKGKRHFVWLASNTEAAVYMIDRRRSAAAFQRLIDTGGGLPPETEMVTDRYSIYRAVAKIHQYCLAHLIRDFRGYAERDGPDKATADALEKELKKACQIHRKYREGKYTFAQRNAWLEKRKRKVEFWLEDGMANGTEKFAKFCESLLDKFDHLWCFMRVKGMEPTNNLAERDLRKLVLWRKKSYGTRSERGKRFVERVTTVAQTLKRRSHNVLDFLHQAVANFYRGQSAPYISEALGF